MPTRDPLASAEERNMTVDGYVALCTLTEDGVGERVPAVVRIDVRGAMLDLADGSRRIAVTLPPGAYHWRLGFFRAEDAALFYFDWFSGSPGDSYTIDLPPAGEPVWVLQ